MLDYIKGRESRKKDMQKEKVKKNFMGVMGILIGLAVWPPEMFTMGCQ